MIFRIRPYAELLQTAINRVVARSALTDLTPGSKVYQVLGAAARLVEQLYIETARLLELFGIDRAQGTDLDDRAREYMPDGFERGAATYASGTLRWARPASATGTAVAIPVGTVVARTGANPRVVYVTTAAGEILAGATQSQVSGGGGDIPARAELSGAAGNTAVGTVTRMVSVVAGTSGVTNPRPFVGGDDAESDDAFRARIRERTRSLARCIREALESRAKDAEVNGQRVTVARCIPNVWRRGDVTLYVDDGAGGLTNLFAWRLGAETLMSSATGGERYFYTTYKPLQGRAWTVKRNGAPLTKGTDYELVPPWGMITLSEDVFPTGLAAGDTLTIEPYTYWTGLMAEAQRLIDGDPADPTNYPAWHAEGVVVRCAPPEVNLLVVRCVVAVLDGYTRETVIAQVRERLSDYVNSLNVGDDVILAELVQRAMDVPGMYDVNFERPTANTPIADDEVARLLSTNLSVE